MQGTLKEFGLAEILQLVASQQKTGLLRVVRGEQLLTFYFDHGILLACRDRRHLEHDPLRDYVVRYGFVDAATIETLCSKVESTKQDLADVLLEEQFLTEEELHVALEDLAQDLVYRTFAWHEGTYQFVSGDEAIQGLRHPLPIKMDGLLMEAARRVDEWPRLLEKLHGPDVLLDAVDAPPTSLGPRAHSLLSQLTDVMRLGELVRRARIPEFEVYEIVAQALESRFVRVLEMPALAPARVDSMLPPRRLRASAVVRHTLPALAVWGVAIGISIVAMGAAGFLAPRVTDPRLPAATMRLATEQARESVRRSLEVYRALHGRYPRVLGQLATDDLASALLISEAAPLEYIPSADGRSFQLVLGSRRTLVHAPAVAPEPQAPEKP